MAGDRGRINFSPPYPYAPIGGTGYRLDVHSAVPRGAGYSCFLAVWNGEAKCTSDDVLITNPTGRNAFLEWVATQLDGIMALPEQRLVWWNACELLSVNLQGIMGEHQAEQGAQRATGDSAATRLVALAHQAGVELFHTSEGDAYATIQVDEHRETWPLRVKGFRRWLARKYFEANESTPGSQATQDALAVLEGQALYDGPELAVDTRIAEYDGALYIDLVDAEWRAVRIDASGWQVISDPPVRFRRSRGMLPLPVPVRGGNLDELRPFLNCASEADWQLRVGWLIGAFRRHGPFGVLVLHGEHGSAKSTAAMVLRRLIDPNTADLRSTPRDERDLMIAATNGWVVAYDNLSHLPVWLSDAICRVATGAGFGTRELYSDAEETIFAVERPLLINGIEELATRGDLLDRSIIQYQPYIDPAERRDQKLFWNDFEQAHPRIPGALCQAVSVAISKLPTTTIARKPRLADFALWVTAAESALGWETGTFMTAYQANLDMANELSLEAAPIVPVLRTFLDRQAAGRWEGTATALLKELGDLADDATLRLKSWPRQGNTLGNILRRLTPNLRVEGIDVIFRRESRSRTRIISLEKGRKSPSASSASSPGPGPEIEFDENRGRWGDDSPASADDPIVPGDDPGTIPSRPNRDAGDDETDADDDLRANSYKPVLSAERLELDPDEPTVEDIAAAALGPELEVTRPELPRPEAVLITSASQLRDVLPTLLASKRLTVDVETTGLDPLTDHLRLIQLAVPGQGVAIIDTRVVDVRLLDPVFDDERQVVLHNGTFDMSFLLQAGVDVRSTKILDTMLVEQVLEASSMTFPKGERYGLAATVERRLGMVLPKELQVSDWSGSLSDDQLNYAATDAAVLLEVADVQERELRAAKLLRVAQLEGRAVPAVAWLELNGCPIDAELWCQRADEAVGARIRTQQAMVELTQRKDLFGDSAVSWDSPQQMLKLLRERGHTLESTDEEDLAQVADADPLVPLLLQYREAARLANSYRVDYIQRHVLETDDRLHPRYWLMGASTGRMSCDKPNVQQIPHGPAYRRTIAAPPGRALVKADYGQIELRLAADLAKDAALIEAFNTGQDPHALTASLVLGVPLDQVTKDDRQKAKALNFGLQYGMGAPRLRAHALSDYRVSFTLEQATTFREKFFDTYRGLRQWHRGVGRTEGPIETRTPAGRRRLQVSRYTEKLSSPIQGAGGGGIKGALALCWERRHQVPDTLLVLSVHDELVAECAIEDTEQVAEWLRQCMTDAMQPWLKQVPVVVETTIGKDWAGTPL